MTLSATFRGIEQLKAKCRAIHAASRQLGLDDETRRAMIETVAGPGKRSTLDLNLEQADRLLDQLKNRGATLGAKKTKGIPANFKPNSYYAKIEALLADMQLPWAYAQKVAENITGGKKPVAIKRLEWLKDDKHFRAVIAALAVEKKKRVAKMQREILTKLQARGLTEEWANAQAEAMGRANHPWAWNECLETLRLINAALDAL